MYSDALLVIAIATVTACVGEALTYLLVYRTDEYKRLTNMLERKLRQVEKRKEQAVSVEATKADKKKLDREEEQLKEANKAMSMFRMKSMFAIGITFTALLNVFSSMFEGHIVAKLPFHPISLVHSISHRNLIELLLNRIKARLEAGRPITLFAQDLNDAHTIVVGIIGGTGLEKSDFMIPAGTKVVETPYGEPSDSLTLGTIDGVEVVVLARHGRDHRFNPTNVNFRANLWAMKSLGVNIILASNASGSLREELAPGAFVVPSSFIDWTQQRPRTFYDGEPGHPKGVCHIPCFPTYSESLRKILHKCSKEIGVESHDGTIICIEGPRFSSRAESIMFRQLGADVINMTACPEVYLAKELGILYVAVALVTDYDCWKVNDTEFVSVEHVKQVMVKNAENTTKLFRRTIQEIKKNEDSLLEEAKAEEEIANASVMC
ncbi:hypothetical protein FO519_006232 [Halicephalobus sp. NKZ332]|nr:hypothetical protein FO519_006232 [Halicephalobus sp. NKZ332]